MHWSSKTRENAAGNELLSPIVSNKADKAYNVLQC